jgi:hypothetical protein
LIEITRKLIERARPTRTVALRLGISFEALMRDRELSAVACAREVDGHQRLNAYRVERQRPG